MSNQVPSSKLQEETAKAEYRKLELEISSLEWQNSRFGVLSQFTTLITVAITLVTVMATLIGWGLDRMKERELRTRELAERIENQYRSNIQQLIRYPVDANQTPTSVVFIFDDLSTLIETGYTGEGLTKRRSQVGTLLGESIKSPEFDLTKLRNVEFDYVALKFCSYYSETLIKDPKYTRIILERYASALEPFHKEDGNFKYVGKVPGTESSYGLKPGDKIREGFTPKLRAFATMIRVYELHLDLLKRSIREDPESASMRQKEIEKATCDFHTGTQNGTLTKDVFKIDDTELNARLARCKQ